jgi:hypothetical protein
MRWLYAAGHVSWRAITSIDLRDILGLVGFGLLVYGVSEINREAAFIVAGVLLLAIAALAARK